MEKKKYYFMDEALTVEDKGYKEYAMYFGTNYIRARLLNDVMLTELYFSDENPNGYEILSVAHEKTNFYTVSQEDASITRDDGMKYVYVPDGLMREQDKRLYKPKPIDQYNLPPIIYKIYKELWKEKSLFKYRTDPTTSVREINIKNIQEFIQKINTTTIQSQIKAKNKIRRQLCKQPPKI